MSALQKGYGSEALGAELFRKLAQGHRGADARQRRVLLLLQHIEEQTRDSIASLMLEQDTSLDADGVSASADRIATHLAGLCWQELHAFLLQGSQAGRGDYEAIRIAAPNPADPRIGAILSHVDVVNAIYGGEAAGEPRLEKAFEYLNSERLRILGDSDPARTELG